MSDPDSEKTRIRNTGKNEQVWRVYSIFHAGLALALSNKCFRLHVWGRQKNPSVRHDCEKVTLTSGEKCAVKKYCNFLRWPSIQNFQNTLQFLKCAYLADLKFSWKGTIFMETTWWWFMGRTSDCWDSSTVLRHTFPWFYKHKIFYYFLLFQLCLLSSRILMSWTLFYLLHTYMYTKLLVHLVCKTIVDP